MHGPVVNPYTFGGGGVDGFPLDKSNEHMRMVLEFLRIFGEMEMQQENVRPRVNILPIADNPSPARGRGFRGATQNSSNNIESRRRTARRILSIIVQR